MINPDAQLVTMTCRQCSAEFKGYVVPLCDTCLDRLYPPPVCEVCGEKASHMTRWDPERQSYKDAEGNYNPPRDFCNAHIEPFDNGLLDLIDLWDDEDSGDE